MCTVSIIRTDHELIRIACNRDEQLTRPPALSPRVAWSGRQRAVMPTDPAGGGTWIAANEAGVVMVLLNLNRGGQSKPGAISRGNIIPSLIHCATVESALAEACALQPAQYGPFRLVMLDRLALARIDSNGRNLRATREPLLDVPILFTSSGLGDELVEPVRRELFEQMVQAEGASPEIQDAFHRHHWGNRPHLSVCMRRSDARTVSHSIVELHPDVVRFRYHPAAPDESADDHVIELSTHTLAPA